MSALSKDYEKKKHKAIEGDRVESIILERVIKEDLLQ
jgi:hypothetical protein